MKTFFTKLHYEKKPNIMQKTLLTILSPASFAYYVISELRNNLYKKNLLKSYSPKVLTVSIGNLTTGGTGKTPITASIANYLNQKGYKTAILSRGYGSKLNPKNVNVISNGEKIFYNANIGGDEPVWLAHNCPQSIVLTSSDRIKIAKFAQDMGCNALILDDGFQHQRLNRNINILVADSEKMFGNKKLLPCGPLRESLKNLSRANAFIIVNKTNQPTNKEIYKDLPSEILKIECNFVTDKVYEIHSNQLLDTQTNQRVLAFSAIGQPEQFYNLIKENGLELIKTISFPDHHSYSLNDIDNIIFTAQNLQIDTIITTEKDSVKIQNLTNHPIFALKLKANFSPEAIFANR